MHRRAQRRRVAKYVRTRVDIPARQHVCACSMHRHRLSTGTDTGACCARMCARPDTPALHAHYGHAILIMAGAPALGPGHDEVVQQRVGLGPWRAGHVGPARLVSESSEYKEASHDSRPTSTECTLPARLEVARQTGERAHLQCSSARNGRGPGASRARHYVLPLEPGRPAQHAAALPRRRLHHARGRRVRGLMPVRTRGGAEVRSWRGRTW